MGVCDPRLRGFSSARGGASARGLGLVLVALLAGCGSAARNSRYIAPVWDDVQEAGDGDFDARLVLEILSDTESVANCASHEDTDLLLGVTVGETESSLVASMTRREDQEVATCLERAFRDRISALHAQGGSVLYTVHVHLRAHGGDVTSRGSSP